MANIRKTSLVKREEVTFTMFGLLKPRIVKRFLEEGLLDDMEPLKENGIRRIKN